MPTSSDLGHLSLIEVLTPTQAEQPGTFVGRPNAYGAMGIYGGHFCGQALSAGLATVADEQRAHSFHAYFLRPGDPEAPITYRVSTLRNGRSSSVRLISAEQNGVEAFTMMASFKRPEDGDQHQPTAPLVPPAETLVAEREARGEAPFPFPVAQNGWAAMEWITPSFLVAGSDRDPVLQVWMRIPDGAGLTDRQHQVLLAFLSDGPLMFNATVPYGVIGETHRATSLDHAVWFHHPVDPSGWLLFDQRSTAAADGRGINEGEIYDADGRLAMTCIQESMLRRLPVDGGAAAAGG